MQVKFALELHHCSISSFDRWVKLFFLELEVVNEVDACDREECMIGTFEPYYWPHALFNFLLDLFNYVV